MRFIARMPLTALFVLVGSGAAFALTEEQCVYFAVDGTTAICHAIPSPQKPFIPLQVPTQACFPHAEHANDYVAFGDPECQGGGCFPEGAPCDGTVACCEGLACGEGVCQAVEANLTSGATRDATDPAPAEAPGVDAGVRP